MSTVFHVEFDEGARPDALDGFGYTPLLEAAFSETAEAGEVPARVVEEQRDRFRIVRAAEGFGVLEEEAKASGALRREADSASQLPAVGDWVSVRPAEGSLSVILRLLPRTSAFMRKAPGDVRHDRIEAQVIAANVNFAFIVAAAGLDWNPRRVERYVALALAAGTTPVLVIAKSDLAENPASLLAEAARAAPGLRTAMVCAPEGSGLGELSFALERGKTVVLLGSSGAGKSTLLNALAGEDLAGTGEVRVDDQRGRHTTTHRHLYRLGSGALVIDTPGMRELQLWADEEAVGSAFPEIEALAADCRFRDCAHGLEPGCAVRAAVESGELEEGRFASWRKLSREAAYLRTKENHSAKDAERRRWKSIEMSRRSFAKASTRTKNE